MAFKVAIQSGQFEEVPMAPDESLLLERTLDLLVGGQPSSLKREVFDQHREFIRRAAMVSKNVFDTGFGGINPADVEFGIQPLRPLHFHRNGNQSADATDIKGEENSWRTTAAGFLASESSASGLDNWIGGANGYRISKELLLLVFGIEEVSATPKIDELKIDIDRDNIIVFDTRDFRTADNKYGNASYFLTKIPVHIVRPLGTIRYRVRSNLGGPAEPRLLGVTLGTGRALKALDSVDIPD